MLTQKEQALIIIALSNVAMMSSQASGQMPTEAQREIMKGALEAVRPAAMILTDDEMLDMAASASKKVLDMAVKDVKITPEPVATVQ